LFFKVALNVVVTDDKFVVGEVFTEILTLITAAGQNCVNSEDRDSCYDEDWVHEGAQQAVDVEVSLKKDGSGHEFISLCGIPGHDFKVKESVESGIDDPLN
jgi:hypothetical protein